MVHLDYRDARPIYTQITDGFRDQILKGILLPGEKLPSVRELATQLSINPNTIQRAYHELEAQGWIASVPGKGSFVCGIPVISREEQQALLSTFIKTARTLLAMGISKETLIEHLEQGGNQNASDQ